MPTKLPIGKLRERVKAYLGRVPAREIKDDEPSVVVLAPVEAGISRFIDVDNLPDLKDIPFIPERMRDFAFRYATEYKPYKFWMKEYGVRESTIGNWLRHEGVRAYIAICRYEQRMFNLAQHVIMQRNVYRTINKILNTKITPDTIGAITSMAKFIYQILTTPGEASGQGKETLNLNIGFSSGPIELSGGNGRPNPYAQERNVTPKQLKELQEDIDELEILADGLSDSGGDDE